MVVAFGVVAWLLLTLLVFIAVSWMDEDVNHWNWPKADGPGVAAELRFLALTAAVAAIPAG